METPKELLGRLALADIPKILTLADRNPHSPTYGCFDRNFWHYKIIDFPSGMSQEFVLPLALAWEMDIKGNPYFQKPEIEQWIKAGIRYAAASAHSDGSCDDYFPHEKAMGATAFSLYAVLRACEILNITDPDILEFVASRANFLAGYDESGRLSNHQALVALCLFLAAEMLGDDGLKAAGEKRMQKLLTWQSDEGWFYEYQGCDPGYLTLTLGLMAEIEQRGYYPGLLPALKKAVDFLDHFIHPDGSFGGEYTSRNTYNFFPHGFELLGDKLPKALRIADCFYQGLVSDKGACYADDHIIGHHLWSYLLASRHYQEQRPDMPIPPDGLRHFKQAGLLVDRRQGYTLYVALNKGGACKLFKGSELVLSDTQFSLRLEHKGKMRTAVGHLVDDYQTGVKLDEISITGSLGWAKQAAMTPFKLIALRLIMLLGGRLFPNLVRGLLQKLLIVGKEKAPFSFERAFRFKNGQWKIEDRLSPDQGWDRVKSLGLGVDQTSIYVVMSRTYQAGQLAPWHELGNKIPQGDEPFTLTRKF
jgi:hypothetical protein